MNDETHDEPQTMDDVAEDIRWFISDLITPCSATLGFLELLSTRPRPLSEEEQKQFIDAALQSQKQLRGVINELMDYSQRLRHPRSDQETSDER